MLGGPNGIVGIDKSMFGKRKYNNGKQVNGTLVFRGIERSSNKCFFNVAQDRSKDTLLQSIKSNIKKGATIIYDCLEDESLLHLSVNHKAVKEIYPPLEGLSSTQTCRFELQEVEETINLAVSDLASFPPCVSPGCPHHDSGLKIITPKNSPDVTPTKRVLNLNSNRISNKRKEELDFEYPPLRKTTKKQILNIPNDSISISPNRFSLPSDSNIEEITGSQNAIPVVTPKPPSATGPTPSGNQNPVSTLPPVMLRITETVRSQMKIINEKFPKIRSRTTGEFIKLYTDNLEQFHELLTFAKN
ncbi:DDE_Tnp_IS1595 domain-containing protein [Trichonephila clavipes]|nr:DDE_Tnp_IS1595 domain-containing protein [Trichonephila clavipes]